MAEFFAETGYKNPQDSEQTVFQYAHGWNGNLWSYYEAHPEKQQQFNVIQQTISAQQPAWTDIFPVHTLLEVDSGHPLLVDVGGSTGHDLLRFYNAHPETASLLYLEDLESVIQKAELPESINKIAYNFFSPQPVMGKSESLCPNAMKLNMIKVPERTSCTPSYTTGLMNQPERFLRCRKML